MDREIDYYQLGHKRPEEIKVKMDMDIAAAKKRIKELEQQVRELQDRVEYYEMEKAWTPPPGCTNVAGFYGEFQ